MVKGSGIFIWTSCDRLLVSFFFKAGDEIITMDDLYGGTYRMFTKIYNNSGIKFHYVDMNNLENVQSLINENTKMVWVETPTNPLMKLADIAAVAITKANNILFAVDNTLQHHLQNPLDWGGCSDAFGY
jgi:cystathionine beta-lyase